MKGDENVFFCTFECETSNENGVKLYPADYNELEEAWREFR